MKTLRFAAIAATLALTVLSACDSTKSQLASTVETLDDKCDLDFGDLGTLNSIDYENDTVSLRWTVDPDYANVDSLAANEGKLLNFFNLAIAHNDNLKSLASEAVAAEATTKAVFKAQEGETRAIITVSPEKMKELTDLILGEDQRSDIMVTNIVDNLSAGQGFNLCVCPPEGLALADGEKTNETVIIVFECADRSKSVAKYRSYENLDKVMRYDVKEMIRNNQNFRQFVEMLDNMGSGLKVRYRDADSPQYVEVDFTRQQVHALTAVK